MSRTTCTDHTYGPGDYVAHSEWAEMMLKTHTQHKCGECGLWMIWAKKDE